MWDQLWRTSFYLDIQVISIYLELEPDVLA